MSKKLGLLFLIVAFSAPLFKAYSEDEVKVKISAYVDSYIATDNDNISKEFGSSHSHRKFSVVDGKKGEFGLNVAQISADLTYQERMRGVVTLHYGDLPNSSHGPLQRIQEAYGGFQLFNGFWLDAGFFLTHIGGESLLPKDNWLSSHSMVTYYEPFFHAGLKATYETGPITASLLLVNGNGIFQDNNDNKSFGMYFGYSEDESFSISYANIIGNEVDGEPKNAKMHMLHNICVETHPTKEFGVKAQVDIAMLEDAKLKEDTNDEYEQGTYIGASVQGKYQITDPFSMAARLSWHDNADDIYGDGHPTSCIGFTYGLEYKPVDYGYIRLETRYLMMDEGDEEDNYPGKIFRDGDGEPTNSRMEFMLNFGVWLD